MSQSSTEDAAATGNAAAFAVTLDKIYESILKDIRDLLDPHYSWPNDEEARLDDLSVQLRMWAIEVNIKSDMFKWLCSNLQDDTIAIKNNLDVVRSSLDKFLSSISYNQTGQNSVQVTGGNPENQQERQASTAVGPLDQLANAVEDLCDLVEPFQVILALHNKTGPVAQFRKFAQGHISRSGQISETETVSLPKIVPLSQSQIDTAWPSKRIILPVSGYQELYPRGSGGLESFDEKPIASLAQGSRLLDTQEGHFPQNLAASQSPVTNVAPDQISNATLQQESERPIDGNSSDPMSFEYTKSMPPVIPGLALTRVDTLTGLQYPKTELPRVDTFGKKPQSQAEFLPELLEEVEEDEEDLSVDPMDLRSRIRATPVRHADGSEFWPKKLLERILTPAGISEELRKEFLGKPDIDGNTANWIAEICEHITGSQATLTGVKRSYLQIFTLLVLLDRPGKIGDFINVEDGVCDDDLPLMKWELSGRIQLRKRSRQTKNLKCFQNWKPHDIDYFEKMQWAVSPHFFAMDADHKARHFELPPQTVLPWMFDDDAVLTSKAAAGLRGAFGVVRPVKIHPDCHGFGPILRKIHLKEQYFAIKELVKREGFKVDDFENEASQLNRFNGLVHPHLVTLMATYKHRETFHFIFPLAECDLDEYWDEVCILPTITTTTVTWLADQFRGIVGAVDTIHNPTHLTVKKYGRHGDIKPDNILWCKSPEDENGILIISDLGLSALNSDKSRSNIEGQNVPAAPRYRPPECDVAGGWVSRFFDIWTLGCLFLEMLTWFMGGSKLRDEFSSFRTTVFFVTGALNDTFYELKRSSDGTGYVQVVKKQVTDWIDRLRNHPNSTAFTLTVLEIIENEMLVVLSTEMTRSSSKPLRATFDSVYNRCVENEAFCLKPVKLQERLSDWTGPPAVRVELSEKILTQLTGNLPYLHMPKNQRPERFSMTREELEINDPAFAVLNPALVLVH